MLHWVAPFDVGGCPSPAGKERLLERFFIIDIIEIIIKITIEIIINISQLTALGTLAIFKKKCQIL